MSDKVLQKLIEHDKRFDKNDKEFAFMRKKLIEHDKRFDEHDKRFVTIDKRFDEHGSKLEEHSQLLNKLVEKSIGHDARLEWIENTMATKDDLNDIKSTLDVIVKLVDDRTQEILVATAGIRRLNDITDRHETVLNVHDHDIQLLKHKTGLI